MKGDEKGEERNPPLPLQHPAPSKKGKIQFRFLKQNK